MALGVRVTVADDGPVRAALARLALEPGDKSALMDDIGITLSENARLRFIDQVTPSGVPWVPSIRAQVQGGETLRDTGVLMNSITHALVGTDAVEYGTNVPYAIPLHYGATIRPVSVPLLMFRMPGGGFVRKKEVTLPSREFLGVSAEDEEMVLTIIADFLKGDI